MNERLITTNQAVDPVFIFIFGVCVVLLLGITAAMVWFVIRYHRSRAPQPTSAAEGNLWLEVVWTVLPTVLVMAMFAYGWSGFLALRTPPKGALTVTATARMWSWNFTYANGKTSPKLFVPAGKPVRVELESKDVIHGFFIPAFRVKRDVVPGMKTDVWFVAPKTGSFDLFCSVYCGTGHSAMITSVEALPEAEFAAWLTAGQAATTDMGKELLEKYGCVGCHSLDGSKKVGPTFKGLFGSDREVKANGTEIHVKATEEYLRESIRQPAAKVVDGFPPVMPPYPALTDEEVNAIIRYMEGLK